MDPLVQPSTKSQKLNQKDWETFNERHFGEVIFLKIALPQGQTYAVHQAKPHIGSI